MSGPSPRAEFGFAYDTLRAKAVIFGGSNNLLFTGVNRETWEWDGRTWTLVNDRGPAARCDNAMAFDAARSLTVSFGGYSGVFYSDTWTWDGLSWLNANVTGPTARADSFMVFDSCREVLVLFGGLRSNGTIAGDTWEWDGKAWTLRASTGPPSRWIQRMAYDAARGITVMFGGATAVSLLDDTWEWDGRQWTQREVSGPPARYGHAMAYDSHRNVTVLFGGQTGFNFGDDPLGDTWEWDGKTWTLVEIAGPSPRTFVKMIYDEARRKMVLFGGYDGTQFVDNTWEYSAGAFGDFNCDGNVNSTDYSAFQACFTGPGTYELPPECAPADFNNDGAVDLIDFGGFQAAFTPGP